MLHIELNPFTELHTDRLHLRQVTLQDAPEILFFRSNPTVMQYLDREPLTTLEEAETFIKEVREAVVNNEGIMWGLYFAGQDTLIGTIGLWRFIKINHRAEIGYTLHPELQGKGLMSEAMKAVLKFGFENLKLHSVEANVNPHNQASINLIEKHGFVKEAHFKEDYYFQGRFLDSAIYSLLGRNFKG